MDFEYSPVQEAFRKEFRAWLAANLPPDLCLDDAADDRVASDRETFERRRAWQKTMHAAGWVGITWPTEYGGRGAGLIERVIWEEEYAAARAPVLPGNMALNLVGPTIIHWGTDAQKRRHLPAILAADEIWCQGFSEPGAGSDLASLRTRAVDRGDHYVVNGQKVWTSGAHFAHWIILLVRTDPDAPKHRGISCLLVPMRSPGISVRPLVLMTGHHHFNEVFFTDVAVPTANLLGPPNQGWKVSTTTLMYERHSAGGRSHAAQIARLAALARRVTIDGKPAWDQPWIRQRLAQLAIDCEALKYTRLRSLTRQLRGEPPGPEGSILKLTGSELGVRIADVAGELLGMHVLVNEPSGAVPDAPRWFNRVLAARQYTISAGTSEIQRNIIGERVLGLPKD
ncbi:MAG TPA: acyl-CoA dehydrogenase [Methylomirabilota bacterium]|jgi:alkylation response protein AidB-like acyl-CoA dehydrogenase|nr:acyl-CoA dehydrogenase [Methylomirabilota bacterium]